MLNIAWDDLLLWIAALAGAIACCVLFQYALKWATMRMLAYCRSQHRENQAHFIDALYPPVSCFLWLIAAVELTSFTLAQIFNSEFQGIKTLLTAAITAVTASWFLMRWKKRLISSRYATAQSAGTAMRLNIIDKAATVAIILFGGILAIEMSGNNWNTLLAFGGIGGLALAFASQEIISNFFGGLMTYITQPFAIGDAILIPEKNIDGNIEELGWYTTKILTSEKKALYVPNAIFSKVVVVNSTRASHRRIRETIRLNYSDLPKVKAIITDIATWLSRAPRIDQVIAPTVFLTTFGTSAIEVCVTAYTAACSTTTFNLIKQDLLFAVSDIIGQHQAQFAYTPDK